MEGRRKWDSEMDEKLRRLAQEGWLIGEMAEEIGVSMSTIKYRMERIGVVYDKKNPERRRRYAERAREVAQKSSRTYQNKKQNERAREIEFAKAHGITEQELTCEGCENFSNLYVKTAVPFCDYLTKHDALRPCETYAYLIFGIEGVGRPLGCELYEKSKKDRKEENKCKMAQKLFPYRYTKR